MLCCGLTWNSYIYVLANPVNQVDPTGRGLLDQALLISSAFWQLVAVPVANYSGTYVVVYAPFAAKAGWQLLKAYCYEAAVINFIGGLQKPPQGLPTPIKGVCLAVAAASAAGFWKGDIIKTWMRLGYLTLVLLVAPEFQWGTQALREYRKNAAGTFHVGTYVLFLLGLILLTGLVVRNHFVRLRRPTWWTLPLLIVSFGGTTIVILFEFGGHWFWYVLYFLPLLVPLGIPTKKRAAPADAP
jgi:hypothetical protein